MTSVSVDTGVSSAGVGEADQAPPVAFREWASALREHLAVVVEHTPGARSAFRRGLRKSPLECPQMHGLIPARFVPGWALDGPRERAVYTVASLAGTWPELCRERSGRSVAAALGVVVHGVPTMAGWAERRLDQLCRSEGDVLGDRVSSAVGVLRSHGVTFDLARLAVDLDRWDADRARIVRCWVREFDDVVSGGLSTAVEVTEIRAE